MDILSGMPERSQARARGHQGLGPERFASTLRLPYILRYPFLHLSQLPTRFIQVGQLPHDVRTLTPSLSAEFLP